MIKEYFNVWNTKLENVHYINRKDMMNFFIINFFIAILILVAKELIYNIIR